MAHAMQILMCGGRRTGKTSILAAVAGNIQEQFAEGSLELLFDDGCTMDLNNYRHMQNELFLNPTDVFYHPNEQMGTSQPKSYPASVKLNHRSSSVPISFRDVQGEYFVNSEYRNVVIQEIRNSQALLVAIDTPHLMEDGIEITKDVCHDVFNRPSEITECVKKAWEGNREPRMILFVPVKCEKYAHANRMPEVLQRVQEGYASLITYGESMGSNCVIAVSPCITMGGMEFMRYDRQNVDEPVIITYKNAKHLNTSACYTYLVDEYGDYYFKPLNCEQPLLYFLMFFIRCLAIRQGQFFNGFIAWVKQQANVSDILQSKQPIQSKLNRDAKDGYAVLYDGYQVF